MYTAFEKELSALKEEEKLKSVAPSLPALVVEQVP